MVALVAYIVTELPTFYSSLWQTMCHFIPQRVFATLISVYKKAFERQSSFAICSALHPSNSHFIILDFYSLKADSFFGPLS